MWSPLKHLLARCRAFARGRDLERDFDQELASHLEMLTEDNLRRGMSPEQARRAATIRFGSAASLRERHRAVRGLPSLDAVLQDLRFAFRLIAKERWFAAAAIVATGLGIGANTTGFGIVNAAFLRGLPVAAAERLYVLSLKAPQGYDRDLTYRELEETRDQSRTFAGLAAYRSSTMNVSDEKGLPEEARGAWVSVNAFSLLPQQPMLGRGFVAADANPASDPVVIIGEGFWRRRYGGRPDVAAMHAWCSSS